MVKVYLLMIHESGLDESYEPFQSTTCAGVFDSPGAAEKAILANEVFNFKEISFMERGGSPRADHCWRWATEVGNTFGTSAFAGIEAHAIQGTPGEDIQLDIGKSEVSKYLGLGFLTIEAQKVQKND